MEEGNTVGHRLQPDYMREAQTMKHLIKIKARPKLNSPVMLAAWPGVGNVAMIVTSYLLRKLEFKDLGEIEASYFFDPIGVLAIDNIIEAPQFPQNKFYYWKRKGEGSDLILFIGDDQPGSKVYELASCILDTAQSLQVEKVFTCAAALTRIHYAEQPRVWGIATSQSVSEELRKYNLVQGGNIQIAGLNGLLLGIAKERDIDGVCLLGEVPAHTSRIENPMAALAIVKVLTKIFDIEIDTTELADTARETKEQIKQATAMAMAEYIEHFTQPIWEHGNGEDAEEDEEDEDEG